MTTDTPYTPDPRQVLPTGTRALYGLSQIALHLLLPLAILLLLRRAVREPGHLRHLSHRLGFGPTGPQGAVWVYAASLGETRAASPLIRHLITAGHPVLLCHMSPAGLTEGHRLFAGNPMITHRYIPLDLFWAVRLFLWRARPRLGLVCEIEIWPAMLIEAARAGVPMVMVNGNLLDRSIGGPGSTRRHLMALYQLFARVLTRTEAYRDRYLRIGVAASRVQIVGEMKYDQWVDPADLARGAALRAGWPGAVRVLMIASSVEAEEPALLAMVQTLLAQPGLRVVWAPRSPQRFDAVAQALQAAGIATARRSALGPAMAGPLPDVQVLLGDSIGEMNAYYRMADLVFVGASLIPHGGHNIMEPMALAKPVVMGPSIYGIAFAAEPAGRAGAFESLPDAVALRLRIEHLLNDPAKLAAMAQAAQTFAESQTGAAGRSLAALAPWLDRGPDLGPDRGPDRGFTLSTEEGQAAALKPPAK